MNAEEARVARRDKKRAKARHGMVVDNKAARMIERLVGERAQRVAKKR